MTMEVDTLPVVFQSDGPTLQEGPLPDSYSNALPVLISLPYYLYCYLNFQLNMGSKVQVSFIYLLLIWPLFISLPGFLNRYQTFYITTRLFILLLVFFYIITWLFISISGFVYYYLAVSVITTAVSVSMGATSEVRR